MNRSYRLASCFLTAGAIAALSAAPALAAPSLVYSNDFTGTDATNWGWDSQTDPGDQLNGTDQMVFTGDGTEDTPAFVSEPLSHDVNIYPDGTGTVTMNLTVDLSDYPTGSSDFSRRTLAEIGSSGNKSAFTGGKIAGFGVAGFNDPGEYRFGTSTAIRYWSGGEGDGTDIIDVGTDPDFPLIFQFQLETTITGNDTDGWTVASDLTVTGPVNAEGDVDTLTAYYTFSRVDAGFDGWGSATAYRVGVESVGNAFGEGDAITFDNFSAVIPEPASLALLGLGGLAMFGRRRG